MSPSSGFMAQAIRLAEQGLGRTAPNPCVGAVLVQSGRVVAQGFHAACGQDHAEVEALRDAVVKGVDPRQCTLYVTLEPCNHQGKTPPCTQAILAAGIPEVIIGCLDPNAQVAGGGATMLKSRGVRVRMSSKSAHCTDLIADFKTWQTAKRPFSILKLASTLDGKIATRGGHSAWVSNETSRQAVHKLRSWCQAVIIGAGTFRADNPRLTCRLPGYTEAQPLAVIVSQTLANMPLDAYLLTACPERTIFWTSQTQSQSSQAARLMDLGAQVWGLSPCPDTASLDLGEGLGRLFEEQRCFYTLAEGGGHLATSLHSQGLVDELRLFQAPKVLGDEQAKSVFAGRVAASMHEAWTFRCLEHRFLDTDLYLRLRP